jgi:hypothetical protein
MFVPQPAQGPNLLSNCLAPYRIKAPAIRENYPKCMTTKAFSRFVHCRSENCLIALSLCAAQNPTSILTHFLLINCDVSGVVVFYSY